LLSGCLVGMFHDQTLTYEAHRTLWSEAAWKLYLYTFLELNDVFHSWWFGFFVLVIALNLIACSIERLPRIWFDIHNPQLRLPGPKYKMMKHCFCAQVPDKDSGVRLVEQILGHARTLSAPYAPEDPSCAYFFKEQHRYGRVGVYVIHTALLLIMFGSIVTTNWGVDGMMMIPEGEARRFVQARGPGGLAASFDLGFDVQCDDFRLKTFTDGAPLDFESDLRIYERGSSQPVLQKTIEVNDPLEYKGYTFYQASYAPRSGEQLVKLSLGLHGQERLTYTLPIGSSAVMSDGTQFTPMELIENYGGLGPAVRVQKVSSTGDATHFNVFRFYPTFDTQVRRGQFDVMFLGFDRLYATGISVGKVPFLPIVLFGFVLLFLGMYMAFFMNHRRYWARLMKLPNDEWEVALVGIAKRHPYQFEDEFKKYAQSGQRFLRQLSKNEEQNA
jgi:cytochrome c biogenesis protein